MKAAKIRFLNREISWLAFNHRVLQEAADTTVPLLERLKFLGIFSSNLDEFYRVRVATHQRMLHAGVKNKILGNPKDTLNLIQKNVIRLRDQFDAIFNEVLKLLEQEGVYMINEKELNDAHCDFVVRYFQEKVRPLLVPIMLDCLPKFPYLENQLIYLAVHLLKSTDKSDIRYALIEIPDLLPRFIELPMEGDKHYIIMLDDVIRYGLADIFSILDYDIFNAYTIKLTRDAEFDISDDITKSFYEKISKSIKDREKGQVVRFVYDREMPEKMLKFILEGNHLKKSDNVIPGGRYHNARDFIGFPTMGLGHLVYPPIKILLHPAFKPRTSILDEVRQKDILLHYPYQSYHYITDLLREAAIDPKVKSIKITLYRVAKNSNVVNALINAIRNGKSVTVLIELQARFDEAANIHWVKALSKEGAKILDGVPGLKVHAKLCQIARIENDKKVLYSYISTGNFNESTARIYSDHGLLTAHRAISSEVHKVFEFLENNYKTFTYRHLLVSPFYMRSKLKKLIKSEIKNSRMGKEAFIYLKLNNLVDVEMIRKLVQASQAGVKIRLLIRGICSLVPGIPGVSDNIKVFSIVDKFLEHSRILWFCNDGNGLFYLSSADWMIRNLDNRIEVATPVYDAEIKKQLEESMEIQFRDNVKARIVNENLDNPYKPVKPGQETHRAQTDQYNALKKFLDKSAPKE